MTTTTKERSRKAPLPLPALPAQRGELAEQILRAVILSGDHIATAPCGFSHGWTTTHFILVEIPDNTFRQLCTFEAHEEDAEDNGDAEQDDDGADHSLYPHRADTAIIEAARQRHRRRA